MIAELVTFETYFHLARLNPRAELIQGSTCGYRIETIENPLTRKIRYLDKLVDEQAKGKKTAKNCEVKQRAPVQYHHAATLPKV